MRRIVSERALTLPTHAGAAGVPRCGRRAPSTLSISAWLWRYGFQVTLSDHHACSSFAGRLIILHIVSLVRLRSFEVLVTSGRVVRQGEFWARVFGSRCLEEPKCWFIGTLDRDGILSMLMD